MLFSRMLEARNRALQESLANVKNMEQPLRPPVLAVKPSEKESRKTITKKGKGRITGWQLFIQDEAVLARLQNPSCLQTRLKEMSAFWKEMSVEERKAYKDKASLENRGHT